MSAARQQLYRPLLTVLAFGMVSLGWLGVSEVVPAVPSAGAASANCSSGVIVAADFSYWGKNLPINSVCVPNLPPNAADALVTGGFHPVGVSSYGGLAFICTIAGYPQGEDCNNTPPGDAYWSFWYADAGTWTYSEVGATELTPVAGSVEYWEFGGSSASDPPTTSPDALRAATTPPTTTTTTTTTNVTTTTTPTTPTAPTTPSTPSTGPAVSTSPPAVAPSAVKATGSTDDGTAVGTTKGSTGGTGSTSSSSPSGTSTKSGSGPHGSTTPGTTPSASSAAPVGDGRSTTSPKIVDAAPVVATDKPAGSSAPFVVGALAVVLLAATGGLVAWRRRRTI